MIFHITSYNEMCCSSLRSLQFSCNIMLGTISQLSSWFLYTWLSHLFLYRWVNFLWRRLLRLLKILLLCKFTYSSEFLNSELMRWFLLTDNDWHPFLLVRVLWWSDACFLGPSPCLAVRTFYNDQVNPPSSCSFIHTSIFLFSQSKNPPFFL